MTTRNSLKPKMTEAKEAERANQFPRGVSASPDTITIEETVDTAEDLELLSYKEVQAQAKLAGVKASGSKAAIIARLKGD